MTNKNYSNNNIKKYAYLNISQIYHDLNTSINGLSNQQVEQMQKRYGNNVFNSENSDSLCRRIRRSFLNPFNIILFILGIISLITDVFINHNLSSNPTTAIIIFIMIFISGIIRLSQELKAKNALDKLDKLVHKSVTVRRNGDLQEIPIEQLVVGDIVLIGAGDKVAADIRLISVNDLYVSQASITGESAILEKNDRTLNPVNEQSLINLDNLIFMASNVISGKAEGVVIAIGEQTLYGNYAKFNYSEKSDFEKGANSIASVMLRFMVILVPIVFVILGISKGDWALSLAFALSIAVGLMPEMLPMVITACLAKGSLAMGKKHTIIKNINAMQSFGSMDVLCIDKTGTLTNANIILEYYMDVLGNECFDVLDMAYINSFYHSGVRNPIDNAILACQSMPQQESHFNKLINNYTKIDEIPFDYNRKYVSTLIMDNHHNYQLVVKGDIRNIIERCKYVHFKDEIIAIADNDYLSVSSIIDEMMEDGMKVIAVAYKTLYNIDTLSSDDEGDLILLGYLAFFDAPNITAKESISAINRLKVIPKVLTGDQMMTALSVCKRVGINVEQAFTGSQIDDMNDLELSKIVETTHVFAELTPSQKVRIVASLKQNNHCVGYLGDGINDIPALIEADVGISIDTAIDAAKDSADVILLLKDLNVLEMGIIEGRKTFTNMLKYIKITASSNFGNILSIVCASAFLPFLPMTSMQILLLNLLYDCLCIVLPWDNVDIEETINPKDWSGKTLGRFMLSFGPISSLFDIITFIFLYFMLCPLLCNGLLFTQITDINLKLYYISVFQTGWFLESMWTQVLILHFLRTSKIPFIQSRPSLIVIITTLAGIMVFTLITFTNFSSMFGMTQLPYYYFIFLLIIALLYMVLTTVAKYYYYRKFGELI